MSDIFNAKDLSPYHGDEDFDPRSDLSQGRGDDAEHPTIIPMDLPSSHQESRGPMTRARARALENEVTSFLSDITFDPLETWLLPKSDMLCMIRCQEEPPEDAREDEQVAKSAGEEKQQRKENEAPGPGHPAGSPDIRPLRTPRTSGLQPGNPAPAIQSTRGRTTLARTSGDQPGHSAFRDAPDVWPPSPHIRRPTPSTTEGLHVEARTSSHQPDIWHLLKPRTSGLAPGHPASP